MRRQEKKKRKKLGGQQTIHASSKPKKAKPSEEGEERGYGKGIGQQLAGGKRETGEETIKV